MPLTATQQRLINEAQLLMPLASSEFAQRFLRATNSIPPVATRVIYRDDNTREFFSPAEAAQLPEEKRKKLASLEQDEERYYYTRYGTSLAYVRALDLAAQNGVTNTANLRVMDFGYGAIAHLRLLASLGAHVTGVDPDSFLNALYSQPTDQGAIAPARGLYRGNPGTVTLAHGSWPKDGKTAALVSQNAPYQLIISKNTLKRGYIKPERKVDKKQLIDLGVSDEAFLKSIHDALAPGGILLIYNIMPKPAAPNERYIPWADGHSPFSRDQYAKAGLNVVTFDQEDSPFVRQMGGLLGWDVDSKGAKTDDLSTNLFARYTIVKRP